MWMTVPKCDVGVDPTPGNRHCCSCGLLFSTKESASAALFFNIIVQRHTPRTLNVLFGPCHAFFGTNLIVCPLSFCLSKRVCDVLGSWPVITEGVCVSSTSRCQRRAQEWNSPRDRIVNKCQIEQQLNEEVVFSITAARLIHRHAMKSS